MKDTKNILPVSFISITVTILFLLALAFFIIIAHEVVTEKEDWFDSRIFAFFNSYSNNFIVQLCRIFTFFGSGTFLFPAYVIIAVWLLYKHQKAVAVDVLILAISSSLLLHALKIFFARHRPELPLLTASTTYSFPSGHTMSSFVFCCVLAWNVWQNEMAIKWKWTLTVFLVLLSFVIGISRIVLRYHYPSDVLAGYSLGMAYVIFFFWLRMNWRGKNNAFLINHVHT